MRNSTQFALILVASSLAAHGQSFHQVTISTGPSPRWIAIADVNHDRNLDIVVANAGSDNTDSGTITVLLGDGRGGFHLAAGSSFPAGHLPNDVAIGDMNNDGNLDLVIANHQSPYLRVFLGDGRGGFHLAPGSPVDVHSDPHPHGVVVADFNSDHNLDVATDSWGSNRIEVVRGDGMGRLVTAGKYFPTGRRPYERLRTADFNHDGNPDIVTTNLDDNTVSILLGDGRGGLQSAAGSPFPAGAKPWQVAIDDLNGDGNPDLIVIPYQRDITGPTENAISILLGDGHGGLHPAPGSPLPLAECRGPNSVAAGDLTGDGTQSIVVACAESRTMQIYHRSAAGRFTSTASPIAGGWGSVSIARLTAGPRNAILTANADAGSITIYFPD
ncbi:FG-GAP repeat domain-containing protein [Terriglobus saanensis]|uniref:FG-GAP repeat protein n=1 Tax=Terriglobus saanensis (strain ATCC BAA-1853 / DSM 23119 / SP1PR4) TaxID=401053 RepID=E8V5F9_TERSS|nr:VCBS repeat-containing protein [Terriglobus saanensis]ADV84918.1 FG-GAP repeat protein [Terriglobus saanensis SP1PR4]